MSSLEVIVMSVIIVFFIFIFMILRLVIIQQEKILDLEYEIKNIKRNLFLK